MVGDKECTSIASNIFRTRFILNNHSFNHSNETMSIAQSYMDQKEKISPFLPAGWTCSWPRLSAGWWEPTNSAKVKNTHFIGWGHSTKGMSLSPSVVIEIGLFWKTSKQFSMWFVHSALPMWNFWPGTVFFLKHFFQHPN